MSTVAADPKVSAGDCDGSNTAGATEQAELRSVLGESLSLCNDLYTQLVESNVFENITPPPPSSPKGLQEEEEKVQQQQQQEQLEEPQQQRPRLRRGHKCINKEMVKLAKNPPTFSQSTEGESKSSGPSDEEEIGCNSEVKCATANFKRDLHEMLNKNNNEVQHAK